jgi:hypothetical protein
MLAKSFMEPRTRRLSVGAMTSSRMAFIARDKARVSDALDPFIELGVEVLDRTEHAGGEEGVAQIGARSNASRRSSR